MKKIIALLIIMVSLTGCFTYIRETGKFYPRQRILKPYHHWGINGYRLRQQQFKKQIPQQHRGNK